VPFPMIFIDILSVILQYGLILLIYYFIYKVIYLIYIDLVGKQLNNNRKSDHAKLAIIATGNLAIDKRNFSFDNMITIGRNHDNDIVIDDKYVSHYHAQIKNIESNYLLEDLKSINNTYLNDEILLKEKVLNSGDIIKIGMVTFKFER
jgi:hypothetical protein